jgi:hypothetical protein
MYTPYFAMNITCVIQGGCDKGRKLEVGMVTLWQARSYTRPGPFECQGLTVAYPASHRKSTCAPPSESPIRKRSLVTRRSTPTQGGNLTVSNAKRPDKTGLAGAITHASVLYGQIVHRLSSFLHL